VNRLHNLPLARPSVRQSVVTGSIAGTAYLLEQVLDMRIFPNRYDDLVLWGGMASRKPGYQRLLGLMGHYTMSTLLAAAYLSVRHLLPGPRRTRGLLFLMGEHLATFPSVSLGERFHPGVLRGELPPLMTKQYFVVETARHAAFGLALGIAAGRHDGDPV